ncbi:MAG TPA: cytochrome c3 family protein, partial [Dehalococcoidia bacterium]|nr:cytochrome c3 family protein [Dehalococcoidia bacterium]
MRKLLLLIPGVFVVTVLAVMALSAPSAQADAGPHIKGFGATPDSCANCHRAHRGVAELLLAEEEEQLCLSCHGNAAPGSNLNVSAGTEELSTGALRGGGFETARVNTTDPTYRAPAAFGLPETGIQCDNAIDDDGDTKINDGCPVNGAPETACSDAIDDDLDGL